MKTVIVADDLTGACDTAIVMKQSGDRAYVCLRGIPEGASEVEADVWAINTGSRPLPEETAYEAVHQLVKEIRQKQPQPLRIYKKIDSLFRGNVVSELEAAADAWESSLVLLAPATPSHKRIVRDGYLVTSALSSGKMDLLSLLKRGEAPPFCSIGLDKVRQGELALAGHICRLQQNNCRRILVDGETEEDLLITARAAGTLGDDVVLSGTSGFAAALRQVRARGGGTGEMVPECMPPMLFALGSCHAITRVQCARFLEKPGTGVVWISAENCLRGRSHQEMEEACRQCDRLLEDGVQAVVLATDSLKSGRLEGVADPKGNGEISNREITQTLSQVVQYLLRRHPFGALLLSGGDTAYLQDRCVQRTGDAG